MDACEQTKIDKLLVETLDGSKNEWCWSRANFSANATLAISMTVCRAGASKSEVRLYTYISKLTGKPTDKFMMPVFLFQRDQWRKSYRQLLGVSGVLDSADRSWQCCGGHDH